MNHQSSFGAGYSFLGAGTLGWPRGMVWGGMWEGDSGWGTHVHPVADACWCMAKPIQCCKVNNNNNKINKRKKKENSDDWSMQRGPWYWRSNYVLWVISYKICMWILLVENYRDLLNEFSLSPEVLTVVD